MNDDETRQPRFGTHARFPSQTQWTRLIGPAADPSSPEGREALDELCQTYWPPVYAFLRSQRIDPHRAKDLTQGFFAHLLEGNLIKEARREKGRFRTFLHACLDSFMKDEWRHDAAVKRGGRAAILPIDATEAEARCGQLLTVQPAPEAAYDRVWAATVIAQALSQLRTDYTKRRKTDLFEVLKGCLTGELTPEAYPAEAATLQMSVDTFQTNLSRFKDRFSLTVRGAIAGTVAPADINDEIRHLMAAWAAYLDTKP